MRAISALAIAGLLAACQQQPDPAAQGGNTVAAATPAAPAAGTGAGMTRYVGKYPFDKVDGTAFMADPRTAAAVKASGADAQVQKLVLGASGPQTPIRKVGDRIVSWGCEAHHCGPHNWTLSMRDDGSGGEVCYFREGADPVWYADGKRTARTDPCPSGE